MVTLFIFFFCLAFVASFVVTLIGYTTLKFGCGILQFLFTKVRRIIA